MEKKYVRIMSTMNIAVTPGLQFSDYTDEKKMVPNKLNIKPRWQNATVEIKIGTHYYPAEITKWNTVKALVEKNILTIGEIVDKVPSDLEKEATAISDKFEKGKAMMNADDKKKPQQKKLAEIGD